MQVRVLFFGILKDLAGRESDVLSLPEHATAGDVIEYYDNSPHLRGRLKSTAISVNQEYARPELPLKSGDEVALLPPVSGGSPDEGALVKSARLNFPVNLPNERVESR